MQLGVFSSRASRAALLARRRVLSGLASRRTTANLDIIERFDHPLAPRLVRALRRMRAHDIGASRSWADRIEAQRSRLRASKRFLRDIAAEGPFDAGLTVADACRASRRVHDAIGLNVLVDEFAPERVIELGTNVGISSAYIAAALEARGRGRVVTLEASPARVEVARELHGTLGLNRVDYVQGFFELTLDRALTEPVDFVFIDGHHQFEPTLSYFDRIWQQSTDGALFVFDDIRWSRDMERAWQRLQGDPRLRLAVDLCGIGIGIGSRTPKAAGRLVTPIVAV